MSMSAYWTAGKSLCCSFCKLWPVTGQQSQFCCPKKLGKGVRIGVRACRQSAQRHSWNFPAAAVVCCCAQMWLLEAWTFPGCLSLSSLILPGSQQSEAPPSMCSCTFAYTVLLSAYCLQYCCSAFGRVMSRKLSIDYSLRYVSCLACNGSQHTFSLASNFLCVLFLSVSVCVCHFHGTISFMVH